MCRRLYSFFVVILIFAGSLVCYSSQLQADAQAIEIEQSDLVCAAQQLPLTGILMTNSFGELYLKIDEKFQRLPLTNPKLKKFTSQKGPHIQIVYDKEDQQKQRKKPEYKEVGQSFPFKVVKAVEIHFKSGMTFLALEVDSPELEQLRIRNGFSSFPEHHDKFYIYLGLLNK
ncbi:MAG: hypothetical protein H0T62_04870 [Parachlamydiaceae bacterium]|nr:hypothetical protein [Parachlamydiaceae bacterium]